MGLILLILLDGSVLPVIHKQMTYIRALKLIQSLQQCHALQDTLKAAVAALRLKQQALITLVLLVIHRLALSVINKYQPRLFTHVQMVAL